MWQVEIQTSSGNFSEVGFSFLLPSKNGKVFGFGFFIYYYFSPINRFIYRKRTCFSKGYYVNFQQVTLNLAV